MAKTKTNFFETSDSVSVTFYVNGDEETCRVVDDNVTLLNYLRQNGKTDTKKMCQEGGCGVCSVIEMVDVNGKEKYK